MSNNYFFDGNVEVLTLEVENAAGFTTTITTNATANRTLVLPDSSGTIALGGGSIPYALFYTLGAQPGSVAAGQPLTYSNTAVNNSTITSTTAIQGPFSASGTVFTLLTGTYSISWQQTITTGAVGTVVFYGTTLGGMARIAYSAVGQGTGTAQSTGSYLQVVSGTGYLAICADSGNTAALAIGANSSTTNQASTTITFLKIA